MLALRVSGPQFPHQYNGATVSLSLSLSLLSSPEDIFFSLLIEREEGKWGWAEREKHQLVAFSDAPWVRALTEDQTCQLGMCSDSESNPQPCGLEEDVPTN